ncbi:NACHT and WD repeat domain-containing protein 2 isoform X2 [Acanthopagrus latus]|uniref:NACHT and WD repeat domain-containing protein 2 isoform X2 n=1 Tax=Acanthopagrus latus TaxID=8177 RepID=UPI00187C970F|nr:NACHT and WD repeat domain-containing protein 2 isoform X2 [Acanthopagrus latus]
MDRSPLKSTHSSSCVKLYLCSNPDDSVVERRALRESVFPRLREHCRRTLGLDVTVIDPFESSDPSRWPDETTRQQLIKECRESSVGPFLLALVGHQYGTASLPAQVEVSEYQLLLQESQQAGVSTQELERVYQRDENTIPPSYCLRPAHTHACSPQVSEEEEMKMKAKEDELRKVFQSTVSLCVHRGLMTSERAQSYYRSALDADLRFALDNCPSDDIIGRCLVYVHKVVNANGDREGRQMNPQPQSEATTSDLKTVPTDGQLLSELCDSFLPGLITSSQLLVYTTTTECRHGYTTARRWGYTESLCQQVYADLVALTDSVDVSESREDSRLGDALAREQAEQEELRDIMSQFYDVIRPEEEKIRAYVTQREVQRPLVVTGGPCTGKAVLLAHCAQQILQAIDSQCSPANSGSEGGEEESGHVCVPLGSADRKHCGQMLESLLSSSGRRVTSGQQALVNQALTSCCLPLYARLLHLHTSLWHSDSDVTESSLPDGVHSSTSALLDQLEQKHGAPIVARAVSFLTLSKTGLTEAELADLLSIDDEVLSKYIQPSECPSGSMRVPQIDVERLLLDLRRFLIKRTVAGLHVLSWASRHFKLVVLKKYLGPPEARREIHSEMADYFSGRWACGRAKPLFVNQNSSPNVHTAQMNININRQPPSQPFIFYSPSEEFGRVNLRMVLELPHHLQESNKKFERKLLMSLGFHLAMVRAGLLGDLVAMLEGDEGSSHCPETAVISSILKSCACSLQSSPLLLPTLMETSLLPYLEAFPALESFVRQIREEREERGSGLGVALCPAPSSVPSVECLKPDAKTREASVAQVAQTECGIVAEIMDDGTAWFWKGSGCNILKLSLSCEQRELKFAGVKSSGQFVLLSTQCNKLFLWDVTGPEEFQQLESGPESSQETPNRMEGFVACQDKLFMWWKDQSFVSLFDVYTDTMTHFQCQSCVTSLVCSSDGFHMYCGHEEGTVSVFDTNTGRLLSTCSNTNHNAVALMILSEDKRELACVDRMGDVILWDTKTQPPRLVKETFTGDKSNNIVNTDHSDEISALLVCHSHQVTLWDTCDWELWDQFVAPQGRAFSQAVLSQDGHFFLALLDPLVLVWRISTGECVLSLQTNSQPRTLLKTASSVICVACDGCLTVWASEAIGAAGAAQKMRCGVKEVVVEQTGEWFYTTDGSETVWKWGLETGLPHAGFLHDGPVEKLRLSPDNVHFVTLSSGDIYVWQAESGQNILRMSGSRATDILITPNSNCGVSVSERQLSRVWKLAKGSIVCSIHLYLSDAQVSPESTFLIGLRRGDLLAASLWSGSISKRFSCVASSEHVVAFHTLSEHPEFVVLMAASGAVYTWKVAEETVCRHFLLPYSFNCQPQVFQMSSNGSFALLSTEDEDIRLLDLSQVRLCSFKAEAPVTKACLDKSGCYAAYVSHFNTPEKSCVHMRPVLTVVRLADGERIGSVWLCKDPLTLVVCEQHVFVGFEDGSVGVYSILDDGKEVRPRERLNGQLKQCPFDKAPYSWLPLQTANIIWP